MKEGMDNPPTISVQVLFFASMRESLGKPEQKVQLREGSTCEDLQAELCRQYRSLDFVKNRVYMLNLHM